MFRDSAFVYGLAVVKGFPGFFAFFVLFKCYFYIMVCLGILNLLLVVGGGGVFRGSILVKRLAVTVRIAGCLSVLFSYIANQ